MSPGGGSHATYYCSLLTTYRLLLPQRVKQSFVSAKRASSTGALCLTSL
jgi:hypothetical protein